MWQRFKRMIRSLFGSLIGLGEDPERILEQNIRDMNDQVPQMNAQIAMVRANLTLMEKEAARYQRELTELSSKIKAALSHGKEDLAMDLAMQLESARGHASRCRAAADPAHTHHRQALLPFDSWGIHVLRTHPRNRLRTRRYRLPTYHPLAAGLTWGEKQSRRHGRKLSG